MEITVKQAVDRLVEELNRDKSEGSYYHSWQANIAMAFYDEYREYYEFDLGGVELHAISNSAAKRFLDLLTHIPKQD